MRLIMEIKKVRNKKHIIFYMCFIWCCIEHFLNISNEVRQIKFYHIISCFPFFILGNIIREKKLNITNGNIHLTFLLVVIFITIALFQKRIDLSEYNYGASYFLTFCNAVIGSYLLFYFCDKLPSSYCVQTISIGTFLILGIHGILHGPLKKIISCICSNDIASILTAIFILLLLYPIIIWLKCNYPLLLGKINARN